MNTNQIPPGIVAFKALGLSKVLYLEDSTYHKTYETWAKMHLDNPDTSIIHTISVDGTQWSVEDEAVLHFDHVIIESFSFDKEWWFIGKAKEGAKRMGWQVSSLTKLPVKDSVGEEVDPLDYTKWPDKKFDKLGRLIEEPSTGEPTPINPSEPEERKWSDESVAEFLEWVEYNCVMDVQPGWIYKGNIYPPKDLIIEYKSKTSNP